MRSKSIILLALALGCGMVAAIGVSQLIEANKRPAEDNDKQPIFVAMVDIKPNEELNAQNLKLVEYAKDSVPQGAMTKLEEVEGKRSRTTLYAGEPILQSKLLGASEALGAAKDIPPGYRVAHVKIDSITGSSNLILPGDRVDVLLFRQPTNANPSATAAKTVLQDVKVFAVDTHTETEYTRTKNEQGGEPITAKTIALLVTPKQALILHAASEIAGAMRLVLRNPEDDTPVADHGATMEDVFGPEEVSDRNREKGIAGDDRVTAWLDQQKAKAAEAPPAVPINEKTAAPHRKMIVMYGSELIPVDLPDDGSPPVIQPRGGSAPGPSLAPQPVSNSVPLPPPVDDDSLEADPNPS